MPITLHRLRKPVRRPRPTRPYFQAHHTRFVSASVRCPYAGNGTDVRTIPLGTRSGNWVIWSFSHFKTKFDIVHGTSQHWTFQTRGADVMNKAFDISRRRLLLSLPALVMAPRAFVQTANPPIRARAINHVTLDVSDVKRSVDFYQGLFGMPVINRQGTTSAGLQIGNGPQHLGLNSAGS